MHFVRHGQSHFNALIEKTGRDPQIPDPGLTPLGEKQAERAAQQISARGITQIICSPYTRALQTAAILAKACGATLRVEPLAGERALYSCDIGQPATALRRDWPELDFSGLAEKWWPDDGESQTRLGQRVAAFEEKWHASLAAGSALLVSHWYFLNALTAYDFANGEVLFRRGFFDRRKARP